MSLSFTKPKIHLRTIAARNFRNIAELMLDFSPNINLFVGQNGQGKTNLLEAIALSCSLKPLQSLQNIDLIKSHEDKAEISAVFSGAHEISLDITILPRGKKACLNNKAITSSAILAKNIPIVSFIPSELNMITGSGSLRRRALDLACVSLFYEHAHALHSYEKILNHRNRLLKNKYIDKNTVEIFTKLLIKEGANIIFSRLKTLEKIRDFFGIHLTKILGAGNQGSLAYHADQTMLGPENLEELTISLNLAHQSVEAQEFVRRVTLFGPHLHDISFAINNLCAKKCASRGQTRAIILSFKLAQTMAINNMREMSPILILDDIMSELDQNKQDSLLQIIYDLGLQAFFSATSVDYFSNIQDGAKTFSMNLGWAVQTK